MHEGANAVRVRRPGLIIHLSHEANRHLAATGRNAKALRQGLTRAAVGALVAARRPVVHCLGFAWQGRCWAIASRISRSGALVVEVGLAERVLPLIVAAAPEIRRKAISGTAPTTKGGRSGTLRR